MLRRTVSLLFVLLLAGQVWAGVCGCVGGADGKMKCCKRSTANETIGAKRCCGDVCGEKSQAQAPRSQNDAQQISLGIPQSPSVTFSVPAFVITRGHGSQVGMRIADTSPALLARPPDLFLKHLSFRI